jgi:excinuclease Cho
MQFRITTVGMMSAPDPGDLFVYPDHIDRASLDALPARPGIYIFRDQAGAPLYIGKSINIRSRVLSHLRTPSEARMLQQSRHVDFQRTAGEIGALLLESRLIKELQPVHNKKLRRSREMCSLLLQRGLQSGMPQVVSARDVDFSTTQNLYGLFATRRAALQMLNDIVEREQLCSATIGLERVALGRPCFARQLKRCRGACTGEESLQAHFARLERALSHMRIMTWPFDGAIGIIEQSDGWTQTHVVDHWLYLGSFDDQDSAGKFRPPAKRAFDVDAYKILVKPLLLGELTIRAAPIGRVGKTAQLRRIKKAL